MVMLCPDPVKNRLCEKRSAITMVQPVASADRNRPRAEAQESARNSSSRSSGPTSLAIEVEMALAMLPR
jgi:hypothetical protein